MKLFNWVRSLFRKKTKATTALFIRGEIGGGTTETEYTLKRPTYDEVTYGYGSVSNILIVDLKKAE